jgi:LPS sulfotransferase NodH
MLSEESERAAGRIYDLVLSSADYREWAGPPRQTLLICTQQRAGSTLLGEAIYFAGGLGCPLEYYHRGFRPAFKRWGVRDPSAYTAALHRFRTDPSGVFSVKLFWWDLATIAGELAPEAFASFYRMSASQTDENIYRRLFALISEYFPAPTFVFLIRRDDLRQAVSHFVAGETRYWRRFDNDRYRASSVAYDFDRIVQRLAEIQNDNAHWIRFFQANGLRYYKIVYEDLAQDYERTLRAFFDAVGRPDAAIHPPRLRKQADDLSEELFQRFLQEFRRRAQGD